METPLISVIVPVYNTAQYLPRCLDSICGQSYRNLEILCVDDGSTDGSATVLAAYAEKDVRIRVISQKNAGVSAARNNATSQAAGEWICYVDSDDWLNPGIIEQAVSMTSSEVDVVSFGVELAWEAGCEEPPGASRFFTLHQEPAVLPCTPANAAHLNRAVWGKLWRRSVIAAHDVHSPVGLRHEDDAFFYFFMRHCRQIALCPEVGYYYLQRNGSFVRSGQSSRDTALIYQHVLRYVFEKCRQQGTPPEECPWCRDFLTRLHAEWYASKAPELRAELSALLYESAVELGLLPRYVHDYRFRCMVPVRGWRRWFLSRYLNTELWRICGVPLWEVEYRNGQAVQQRFMLLRFIGWKLKSIFSFFSNRASA